VLIIFHAIYSEIPSEKIWRKHKKDTRQKRRVERNACEEFKPNRERVGGVENGK